MFYFKQLVCNIVIYGVHKCLAYFLLINTCPKIIDCVLDMCSPLQKFWFVIMLSLMLRFGFLKSKNILFEVLHSFR